MKLFSSCLLSFSTPPSSSQTNTRLCLSISDFHPDTWNPAWTVGSILTGLVSFMVETTPTLGSLETTTQAKRALALNSLEFNLRDETFCSLFPETATYIREQMTPGEDGDGEGADEDRPNDGGSPGEKDNNAVKDAPDAALEEATGFIGGQVANLCVFLGVAVFAITVKCVLASAR